MEQDFSNNIIKVYNYWTVYIHENQGYLGRCIIWCNRDNAEDLTDATQEEINEFFIILKDLKRTVKSVFQADWFNYSFLGNGIKHLHCHFIPRYKDIREFMGIRFEDKLYGHNYKTDHSFIIQEDVFNKIKNTIKENIIL